MFVAPVRRRSTVDEIPFGSLHDEPADGEGDPGKSGKQRSYTRRINHPLLIISDDDPPPRRQPPSKTRPPRAAGLIVVPGRVHARSMFAATQSPPHYRFRVVMILNRVRREIDVDAKRDCNID
uniref:Uncharacterized protein n=1 Tax=Schizaphis graminum TaxID=13262 RepID=A0A2S2NMT0_SCHGA